MFPGVPGPRPGDARGRPGTAQDASPPPDLLFFQTLQVNSYYIIVKTSRFNKNATRPSHAVAGARWRIISVASVAILARVPGCLSPSLADYVSFPPMAQPAEGASDDDWATYLTEVADERSSKRSSMEIHTKR